MKVPVPHTTLIAERWPTMVLRAFVHALSAFVFTYPLAQIQAAVVAALAAMLGVACARLLARTSLRLWALALVGVVALIAVLGIGQMFAQSAELARAAGPAIALRIADSTSFGLGAFVVSASVRALSLRRRSFALLEVGFIALSFAQLLIAHRQGAINRPFDLADPILAAGADPTIAILAVGGFAVAVILVLLLEERNALRNALHLVAVLVVVAIVFGAARMIGVPAPPPSENGIGNRNESGGDNPRQQNSDGNNHAPVAVVLLNDDYAPPMGTYYFRQSALSYFNGQRLIAANRSDVDRDLARSFPTALMQVEHPAPGTDRTEVHTQVALMADHARPFGLESVESMRPLRNPNPARFVRAYEVTSVALTSDYLALLGVNAGSATWNDDVRSYYTRGPSDLRYGTLARNIVDALPQDVRQEPIAQVLAITQWLGHEGTYSLRSHHASTDDFLFGDKIGYCVDFAHAAVTLMRAVGLPARVATGYQSPESARQGGSTIVLTDAFAHAWPEVYLDNVGWIVADVAVERSLDPPPEPPDPDLQRLLGQMARGEMPIPTGSSEGIPPLIAAARNALRGLGLGLLLLLGALVVILYVAKIWRRLAPRFVAEKSFARVRYRASLDQLSELGYRRAWGESREAFARRVGKLCPSFDAITQEHLAAKFGGALDQARMKHAAQSLSRELRSHLPWWRRTVGVLAPFSFLLSR